MVWINHVYSISIHTVRGKYCAWIQELPKMCRLRWTWMMKPLHQLCKYMLLLVLFIYICVAPNEYSVVQCNNLQRVTVSPHWSNVLFVKSISHCNSYLQIYIAPLQERLIRGAPDLTQWNHDRTEWSSSACGKEAKRGWGVHVAGC